MKALKIMKAFGELMIGIGLLILSVFAFHWRIRKKLMECQCKIENGL